MNQRKTPESPRIVARLKAALGSEGAICRALGIPDNYTTKWKQTGYIPERWALDIHRLNVTDEWGAITAMTVLYEAEASRMRMIREIDEQRRN